jgi:hypothetical protein
MWKNGVKIKIIIIYVSRESENGSLGNENLKKCI